MTRLGRIAIALGVVGLVTGISLMLWPLHGSGLSGTSLRPHYGEFGSEAYEPLPEHPTLDDLRHAGIRVPQDIVRDRRRLVAGLSGAGVLVLGLGLVASRSGAGSARID